MEKYKYMNESMTATPPMTSPMTSPMTKPMTSPMTKPMTSPMASPMTKPMTSPMMNQMMPMTPMMKENMAYRLVYPEIFYRLQPFVMVACDQMDIGGNFLPTQEMVEQVTDGIYNDVTQMYPELADNMYSQNPGNNNDMPVNDPPYAPVFNGFGRGFRGRDFDQDFFPRRFRRRGSLQDLISILLLSELFRRRRRF